MLEPYVMKPSIRPPLFRLYRESVAYQDNVALKNISLQIDWGEKVAFIGPSGAGKTTLLRTLYERAANDAAFVHQHYALVPQLSVFHNVYIGRLDQHSTTHNLLNLLRPQKVALSHITPIFRAIGMEEKMFARVSTLSGGQQQRVAVGRAIYRRSSIILGDEPVSAIDPHQADGLLELVKSSADTVILAMHDVQLALAAFPHVIGLREGRVFLDLPSEEVGEDTLADLYRGH